MRIFALGFLFALSATALAAPPVQKSDSLGYEHLRHDAPEVGSDAPDFTLKSLKTGELVTLSALEGKRPVALVFGSYT